MTVSYQYEVANSTSGGFTRLLFMWRGSLYKLIYRELVLFLSFFAVLSALYRHAFTISQKRAFEQIVIYCDTFINLIPLSFVLGFYVAYVAGRWWQQYTAIPWPDKVMHLVALYVTGNDEYGRMLRRALMRYLNLSLILVLRSISSAVKRRFPTLDHVVDSGFMTSLELELFQSVPSLEFNTYWIPCTWLINLLKEARRNNRLSDAQGLKIIMEEFNDFRSKCGLLWSYDWVSIPLVYTQVVTLATYSFFAVALVGRQYIEGAKKPFQMQIDIYFPVFTVLQFFFFMGLLKVAEQLINPFGDDDEDFELNWLIDRHTKVSYLGVDTLMNRCPPLVKDIYYDAEDLILPYTEAAAAFKKKTYRGSVANMTVPEEKQTMFLPDIAEEEEDSKPIPTPRTSTASLNAHSNESPVNSRRQISGSPPTTPKMVRNCTETAIQFDLQELASETEQTERRTLTDTVKMFSGISKTSDQQNRKPFFAITKPSTVNLQPWPSATNLPHVTTVQNPEMSTTMVTKTDHGLTLHRNNSFGMKHCLRCEGVDCNETYDTENYRGIVNSAFSQERLAETDFGTEDTAMCKNCNALSRSNSSHSDICQFQCHQNVCHHIKDSNDLTGEGFPRLRLNSGSKYLVRRQRSMGSGRKKGVRWKPILNNTDEIKIRRKTCDSVPTVEKIIIQTSSSPNLRNLDSNASIHQELHTICSKETNDTSGGSQESSAL